MSKEEQDFIDRQVETKRALDEEAQRKTEAQKQKSAEQNVKDFEKITKGEHIDNRNLQQIFTEFYSNLNDKRKQIDIKDSLNSAKASLGSLSSRLEARRKKIIDLKNEAAANFDKDRPTAADHKSTDSTAKTDFAADATKADTTDHLKTEQTQ